MISLRYAGTNGSVCLSTCAMGSGVSAFLQHHNMVTNTTVMPRSGIRSGGGNTNWTITREHDAPATRHEIGLDEGQRSQSVAGLNEGVQEGLTNLTIAIVDASRSGCAWRSPPRKNGCLHCGHGPDGRTARSQPMLRWLLQILNGDC